jgi:ferrous iron transport protein B
MESENHKKQVILVGNPNVGKSVLFHALTGRYVTVSNYPGTTVEMSVGKMMVDGEPFEVFDTPGINNLVPTSEDEEVTRNVLLEGRADTIIQVADAKNLRRALVISLQLIEMGLPFILDLNMRDEANDRGIQIDIDRLEEALGVEVESTVATRNQGIENLIQQIGNSKKRGTPMRFAEDIEVSVTELEELLPDSAVTKRSLALMLLSGDQSIISYLRERVALDHIERVEDICRNLGAQYAQPLGSVIHEQRVRTVEKILDSVLVRDSDRKFPMVNRIGEWTMHPIWGIPFLVIVLILMYQFVGVLGAGVIVDYLERVVFGEYLNPLVIGFFDLILPIQLVRDLFVGEYGVVTMALTYAIAIVLPVVGTFFIAFGILEDSGYLPRLAVMVDRIFRVIGLNGKAVLPMILGLGCDTMATLTTRILGTRKEKILTTLLLALGIPCSAQLGVILGMLGGLSLHATFLWVGVILLVLLVVGVVAARLIPGDKADFIMEIPPLRVPQLKNIFVKTIARVEWYLKEAVPLFVLGTLVLFLFHITGFLSILERVSAPVIGKLLGLPSEATQAFIIGFLRRDYGAAGLFVLARRGALDGVQIIVSLVTITLFVPCIANMFIIIKERGLGVALAMMIFIFPFAFLVGGLLNMILRGVGWTP